VHTRFDQHRGFHNAATDEARILNKIFPFGLEDPKFYATRDAQCFSLIKFGFNIIKFNFNVITLMPSGSLTNQHALLGKYRNTGR